MRQHEQRIVIITGAAGGVGGVVVRKWLEAGARVLAVDRVSGEEAERLVWHRADLTNEPGARSMVEAAEMAFGTPDTLIHLAGGFDMGPLDAENAVDVWEKMIAINLTTAFHAFRAVVPAFRARGGGWIVGVGSRAARVPTARMAAYAASKAGVIALGESLSEEVKGDNIHVNLILPSTIDTPANRSAMGDAHADQWVKAEDIAAATLYLCSEEASSLYGTTLEMYARA
jgi:NAD(P)-dependent dehydrogenase (short-subunit alcohol dehydrogenase family)